MAVIVEVPPQVVEVLAGLAISMPKGKKGPIKKQCSKCNNAPHRKGQRYCLKCSADYTRRWRKDNPLSDEQRFKSNVRRKTNMRIKRGLLHPYPCEVCGKAKAEAHHDDYQKPYCIRWLCRVHHLEYHRLEREV